MLVKAKNGSDKCINILLNSFTKDIGIGRINTLTNIYLKKMNFPDLVNVGYNTVLRRITQVCIQELIEKEKLPKTTTKKTWFYQTIQICGLEAILKAEAEKIKKNHCNRNECSIDSLETDENKNFLCDLNKNDKISLIKECNKEIL